ncbi:hypothetical protein CY34DRAFT_812315 [Suillus luteus UH-Slu-Lm8-n1]|uniref:Unplaced genomic scaffold CY34scaffold_515, whole genome shotgun sequence n=1 Tax=Suillus luteus UH-Slu-Lm8-n1 TaxID=930992 RepID=A0A0D0ATF8_9AGAM|nr:hypothetical protein CY34DRAFT_812315 [Suillus luteus UH-Slu-Lm8-n1]
MNSEITPHRTVRPTKMRSSEEGIWQSAGLNQISTFGRMPFENMGRSKGHKNEVDSCEVMMMIQ